MKIEHTEVYGFRAALRGMRNPFDSWDKSDSEFTYQMENKDPLATECPNIGPKDLKLACSLINRGGDHRKFMRMIVIWCDFVLPRYLWQEVDTYKVGTVRNSCSTMNMLGRRSLTQEDFEQDISIAMLNELNKAVKDYKGKTGNDDLRIYLKNSLPEGFLQRATYMMNYEIAYRMFHSRKRHRLPLWREDCEGSICEWIKALPYMSTLLGLSLTGLQLTL